MPFEKEPQFFGKPPLAEAATEKEKKEPSEEERELRLGKRAETEIALPLFKELMDEEVIQGAWKTSKEVDENKNLKVDFVLEQGKGDFVAIDTCIAPFEAKNKWQNKVEEWGDNPLRILGRVHPDYEKKYERLFGPAENLSRLEMMARTKERQQLSQEEIKKMERKIPILCLSLDWKEVESAFDKFDRGEVKGAVEGLYNKETMKLKILEGLAVSLSQYLTNEDFIKKYGLEKLRPLITPKYIQSVENVEAFFQELQKNPERLGHNDIERKIAADKTAQFLEKHRNNVKMIKQHYGREKS